MAVKQNFIEPFSEADLIRHREKWIKIALCTDPLDKVRIKKALADAYRLANLRPPLEVIFVDSPIQGIEASERIADQECVRQLVDGRIWAQARQCIYQACDTATITHVWDECSSRVFDQYWMEVWNTVRRAIDLKITPFWAQHDADNLSFISIFDKLPGARLVDPLIELAKTSGWIWMFEKTAVVSARPSSLRWSGESCVHIEYPDGWTISKLSALERLALVAE